MGDALKHAAPPIDRERAGLWAVNPRHAVDVLTKRLEDAAEEGGGDVEGEEEEAVPAKAIHGNR